MDLTILIPCLNEESTIGDVVKECFLNLKKLKISGEVLVVDNNSLDLSSKIAKRNGARVILCKKRGYGSALKFGIRNSKGKYILMLDADGSYKPSDLKFFWKSLIKSEYKNELVIGSRLRGKIGKGAIPKLHRYLGTPVLTFLLNLFFKTNISDCNSGMRFFNKSSIINIHLSSSGMEFASEMLVKAGIKRLKISEVPIRYCKDKRKNKKSHLKTWKDGWRHLKLLVSYAPNFLFGIPAIVMLLVGLPMLLSQFFGPVELFGHKYDIHIMILGFLISLLGFTFLKAEISLEKDAYLEGYKLGWFYPKLINKFSFKIGIVLSLIIFLVGLIIDGNIIIEWIKNDYQNIYEIRKAIIGTFFIYMGFDLAIFSVYLSLFKKTKNK